MTQYDIRKECKSMMSMTNMTYNPTTQVFRESLIHRIVVLMERTLTHIWDRFYHPTSHEFHIAYWDI